MCGSTWEYVSSVNAALACPSCSDTTLGGMPTASASVAAVWRRSYDTFDKEELGLFTELAWTEDFISEEMVELAKITGELLLSRLVEEEKQTESV
jgi:hypothetical protein